MYFNKLRVCPLTDKMSFVAVIFEGQDSNKI